MQINYKSLALATRTVMFLPMNTWSPICSGKNATPLLNFLKGGLKIQSQLSPGSVVNPERFIPDPDP